MSDADDANGVLIKFGAHHIAEGISRQHHRDLASIYGSRVSRQKGEFGEDLWNLSDPNGDILFTDSDRKVGSIALSRHDKPVFWDGC